MKTILTVILMSLSNLLFGAELAVKKVRNPIQVTARIAERTVVDEKTNVIKAISLGDVLASIKDRVNAGDKRVELIINTPGGLYDQKAESLFALMDILPSKGIAVSCTITGMAASMGAILFSHCSERYAVIGTTLMVHSVQIPAIVTLNENNVKSVFQQALAVITNINKKVWSHMRSIFNNQEYFDENFKIERQMPVEEVEINAPKVLKLLQGLNILES